MVFTPFVCSSAVQNLNDHYHYPEYGPYYIAHGYKWLSSLKRCIFTLIPALGKNFNLFKLTLAIIAV